MDTKRVTVLDLMAEASESVPDSGAAARRPAAPSDELLARIEQLSDELESVQDARARAVAEELMSATLELHGRALARVMELVDETGADGVGLYRTEIPFMVRSEFPDVDAQAWLYSRVLDVADGKPVTFRTLDVGGDDVASSADVGSISLGFLYRL
jgi:phosphotransferase system enzyme I (PtsP)